MFQLTALIPFHKIDQLVHILPLHQNPLMYMIIFRELSAFCEHRISFQIYRKCMSH